MFSIGRKFESRFEVTPAVYNGFLDAFKDRNPLHTDAAFAKGKGFKSEVMHGNILNGFVSYFIGECLPTKNVIIYNQEISFAKPVYLGDSLSFAAEIVDFSEAVGAVQFSFAFRNSENVRVAKGKVQIGLLK